MYGNYILGDIPRQSFREVKRSLRGGVLFGIAYAGGYTMNILSANLKKLILRQLWLLSYLALFWPFVALFTFILCFCTFYKNIWFVLLMDQYLFPLYLPKHWGPTWLGLSVAYAGLTRRLRSAYAGGTGSWSSC